MRIKKYLLTNISIALFVAIACVFLAKTPLFWQFESLTLDMLFRVRGPASECSKAAKIVIIRINDHDLMKLGHWPLPRSRFAELCLILKDLGARQIYFDFLFNTPSDPREDDQLAQAFKSAGNVYLPFAFAASDLNIQEVVSPIPQLKEAAKGVNVSAIVPDMDGKWRRLPVFITVKGQRYYQLILQMVEDALGMRIKQQTPHWLILGNDKDEIAIPLIDKNHMLLNWYGKWSQTFMRYTFSEIFSAYKEMKEQQKPLPTLAPLKNSICLVGITASGFFDKRANPLEPAYPGLGVIATALSNIYNKEFLTPLPYWLNLFLVYLFALIPPFYISSERTGREFVFFFFLGASILGAYALFLHGRVMNFALPFIALGGSYFFVSFHNSTRMAIEKKSLLRLATTDELTGLYNIRYFRAILDEECEAAKKNPMKKFCVLLCDIDHFKRLNDKYGHLTGDSVLEMVTRTLRSCMRNEDVVARYGGDEIIILLRQVKLENALQVAEKIRNSVANLEINQAGQLYPITVSLGVAFFNPSQDDAIKVIKKADDALYAAKKGGRNRVSSYKLGP